MFSFLSKREKGQGLVEYAIILALVAIVVIGVMRTMGPKISNTFSTINSSLDSVAADNNNNNAAPVEPTVAPAPTMTYQQWCASLGFPYHLNASGVCVKTN